MTSSVYRHERSADHEESQKCPGYASAKAGTFDYTVMCDDDGHAHQFLLCVGPDGVRSAFDPRYLHRCPDGAIWPCGLTRMWPKSRWLVERAPVLKREHDRQFGSVEDRKAAQERRDILRTAGRLSGMRQAADGVTVASAIAALAAEPANGGASDTALHAPPPPPRHDPVAAPIVEPADSDDGATASVERQPGEDDFDDCPF